MSMSAKKHFIIHLSGLVQGVGMRYYVNSVASDLGLHGYVRNLPDSRVQCVIHETHENMEHFVSLLDKSPRGRIDNITINESPLTEEFTDFVIRY